jgi:hypothetical protein
MRYLLLSFTGLWLVLLLFAPVDAAFAQTQGGIFGNVCSGATCTTCDIVDVANTLISWLIGAITALFALLLVIAGWRLVTSAGKPEALSAAKEMFTNAIIGFILVLASWLIVDTIMRALLPDGQISGWGPWNEVQCFGQTEVAELAEFEAEDIQTDVFVLPSSDGSCPVGYTNTIDPLGQCTPLSSTITLNPGQECPLGYARTGIDSCELQSGRVAPDRSGNCPSGYTLSSPTECSFDSSNLTTNSGMNPIFDPSQGGSSLVRSGAEARMQAMLSNQFAGLQSNFGRSVTINDALAKSGTSRERNTRNSRHFYGDALDLSTAGMSNADKIRLFRSAKAAGFTGFGFGNTILHVDLGAKRAWDYGNSSYGGVSTEQLKAEARR